MADTSVKHLTVRNALRLRHVSFLHGMGQLAELKSFVAELLAECDADHAAADALWAEAEQLEGELERLGFRP